MADVRTRMLAGYVLGRLLGPRRVVRAPRVTLVMLGALPSALVQILIVLDDGTVASVLGVPFAWQPPHPPAALSWSSLSPRCSSPRQTVNGRSSCWSWGQLLTTSSTCSC
jgi:hypothetical protein